MVTPMPSLRRSPRRLAAFTLIELLVVLAIIALLVSIAAPRYFRSIQHARESSLRASLNVMRDAIDKFAADQSRYPNDLAELVDRHYLKGVPNDPFTRRLDTWQVVPADQDALYPGGIVDVHSGATEQGSDGVDYGAW